MLYVIINASLITLLVLVFSYPAFGSWDGGSDVLGCKGASKVWFFAEGSTRPGFEEWVSMLNPNDVEAGAVIFFMLDAGENFEKSYILPPRSRLTVDVFSVVPGDRDVSFRITSSAPIIAERSMYFMYRNRITGGHDVPGATAPDTDWYFAEGCTRDGFDTWLCLSNPCEKDAVLDIAYYCGDGQVINRAGISITVGRRVTVPVHDDALGVGRHNDEHGDFGIRVTSKNGVPVVAERSMYFTYHGGLTGGHDVLGADAPNTEWYFAEGCTRDGFDTWLCLFNPGEKEALLDIFYYCGDGEVIEKPGVGVSAGGRLTVSVQEPALGVGRHNDRRGDVAIRVKSENGAPVVAERSMYFAYPGGRDGGHDVLGADAPNTEWYFAEGCTRDGFDTWLCISNPGESDALIDVDYFCADGQTISKPGISVPAGNRVTVPVHEEALGVGRHDDSHGDFGIRVMSRNGVPVVAERSMYFAYTNKQPEWRAYDRNVLAASLGWGEVSVGNTSRRRIALTFDTASEGAYTPAILDILKGAGIHCTFFISGRFAEQYPDLVRRIAAEGHEIANHSYSHPHFARLSADAVTGELARTEAIIAGLTGLTTRPYFRFPYGERNAALIRQVNAEGYMSVFWTVAAESENPRENSDVVYRRVVSKARPGAIVLMHSGDPEEPGALPLVIRDLEAAGYELVTLTELLLPNDWAI